MALTKLNNQSISEVTGLPAGVGGKVLQIVNFQTGAVATGTTVLPFDNTIPQITEGTEFMTLAITPTSATSELIIEVVFNGAGNIINRHGVALFVGTTADALAGAGWSQRETDDIYTNTFKYKMTAGVTSALTFRVRSGTPSSGTLTFNGLSGNVRLGAAVKSSITITEYEV